MKSEVTISRTQAEAAVVDEEMLETPTVSGEGLGGEEARHGIAASDRRGLAALVGHADAGELAGGHLRGDGAPVGHLDLLERRCVRAKGDQGQDNFGGQVHGAAQNFMEK